MEELLAFDSLWKRKSDFFNDVMSSRSTILWGRPYSQEELDNTPHEGKKGEKPKLSGWEGEGGDGVFGRSWWRQNEYD